MTLEYFWKGSNKRARLTACPACGQEFGNDGGLKRPSHIRDHRPEDFGLSPMRE